MRGESVGGSDDVPRGVVIPAVQVFSGFDLLDGMSPPRKSSSMSHKVGTCTFQNYTFATKDKPPKLPTNDVFKLPVTAINVVTDNPQELGNCIVDCLQNKLASDIKGETSILGYAIKADVFVSYVMCTMKVCIYSGDVDTKFIVEFQRLHGCNVTFVEALRQVAEHLQVSKFQCELDFKPRPNLPEEGLSMEDVTGEDLMPLINMAGLAEMPLQQAEAAQGLVSLAETENKDIMDLLCESKVLEAIGKLLKSSSLEVLYPTAHLYKHLANETKASGLFENLPELANTIKEKKLAPIVNKIFEEVLKIRESKIMT